MLKWIGKLGRQIMTDIQALKIHQKVSKKERVFIIQCMKISKLGVTQKPN